jgi:hypothetical protein
MLCMRMYTNLFIEHVYYVMQMLLPLSLFFKYDMY